MSISRSLDWGDYVDEDGQVELPNYVYTVILHLMKYTLDLGAIFADGDDDPRLRSFRNRVKSEFKERWYDIAEMLEYMELIVPCGCSFDDFCYSCQGARYLLNKSLSADIVHEISTVVADTDDSELAARLQQHFASFLSNQYGEHDDEREYVP